MTELELRRAMAMRERAQKTIDAVHKKYGPQIQVETDRAARSFSMAEPDILKLSTYFGTVAALSLIDSAVNKARGYE